MKIYLDNNSLTPVDEEVLKVMKPLLNEPYGDLHSPHHFGAKTRKMYNEAMEKVYAFLHSKDSDTVTFTSGASEANSTLFMGVYFDYILSGRKNSIIISEREPISILQMADFLESQGCKVHRIPIGEDGIVEPEIIYDYITPRTALVSISMVDLESGAINPIEKIAQICSKYEVPFHSDATYAVGKIEIDLESLEIDYLSFSSKLLHAPAGTGVLWMRGGRELSPLIQGTRYPNQMFRGGSLNLSGVVALGKAVEIAQDSLNFEMEDTRELRDFLEEEITRVDGVSALISWSQRVANTLLVALDGVEAEAMLYHLNRDGIALFSHSINPHGEWERVSLVERLGLKSDLKHSLVGFALSRMNTKSEIERTIKSFKENLEFLREISPKKGESSE